MKKYILALDLDETLLNSKKEISAKTLNILQKCKQKGFIIAISSTRGYSSCTEIAKQIDADYVCCQSGNMIFDKSENIIFKNPFTRKQINDFFDIFLKYTDEIALDSSNNLFGKETDISKKWGVIPCSTKMLREMEAFKICIMTNSTFEKQVKDYCNKNEFVCRPMREMPEMLLITPSRSDKFFALEKLLKIENSDLEHLIVFGDDNSDILSIKNAKYGVAMANSRQKVLNEAKFITLSNNEDGVAHFLNNTFLSSN